MKKFYIVKDVYTGEWFAANEEGRSKAMSNLITCPPRSRDEMRQKQFQAWLDARVVHAETEEEALAEVTQPVHA